MAQPHRPLRYRLAHEAERILVVELAATQLQAKGVAPPGSREGGQAKDTAAKPLNISPPPSADGVNRMYRQLAEIHAIITA
jgi:hypothetical protein